MPRHDPDAAWPGQRAFAEALLDPDAPLPDGLVRSNGHAPRRRFAVYRNNVVASLTEALGKAYPVIRGLVGEAFFKGMAGHFVRAHPPESPVMLDYGAGFADWLESFGPAARLSYLPDVARLERARLESYHAADAPPLDQARAQALFAGRAPEEIAAARLTPHPSLRLLDFATPALSVWQAAQKGVEAAIPSGRERVVIVRPVETVALRAAAPGPFAFVTALAAGAGIADAAAAGAEAQTGPAFDLSAALADSFAAGFFTDVTI